MQRSEFDQIADTALDGIFSPYGVDAEFTPFERDDRYIVRVAIEPRYVVLDTETNASERVLAGEFVKDHLPDVALDGGQIVQGNRQYQLVEQIDEDTHVVVWMLRAYEN